MRIRTRLSEDSASVALNKAAHAVEHCAVDSESLNALGSAVGRQVLIRRSSTRLALYTVAEPVSGAARAVHAGTAGLTRLGTATDEPFNATLETDFTQGNPQAPVRLTEEVLGNVGAGLAILAPHGGRIEEGTDDQARAVYDALAEKAKPVRAWIAQGFNPATGAHPCWHITSSEISERSFPKLRSLFGFTGSRGPFAHAVAFHGQNDSDAIVVGGGLPRNTAHTAVKTALASQIEEALGAVTSDPPAVEVGLCGPLAGAERRNVVNRVTVGGNGLQLEQPLAVRKNKEQRRAVARAVAEFFEARLTGT
jgi:phage replication-related protein YjqB (UPF0714/DUF867 family)